MSETATLVRQQAALMDELRDVLQRHPAGGGFRLMYAAAVLAVGPDQVLVQQPTEGGGVELRPVPWAELNPDDVLHATQTVVPHDAAFGIAAAESGGGGCHSITVGSRTSHQYWM